MATGIPNREVLAAAALKWAMSHRGGYTGADLTAYLASHFGLTAEQLDLTIIVNGQTKNLFGNLVDWVTATFTKLRLHTGLDGAAHRKPSDHYYLTPYGYACGEGRAQYREARPRKMGPADAKPDARQLLASEAT